MPRRDVTRRQFLRTTALGAAAIAAVFAISRVQRRIGPQVGRGLGDQHTQVEDQVARCLPLRQGVVGDDFARGNAQRQELRLPGADFGRERQVVKGVAGLRRTRWSALSMRSPETGSSTRLPAADSAATASRETMARPTPA